MARREQREEASRRRRQEAEASQARWLSARLSETHSPRDLERMDTPSPLPSSPVGRLNRIEAMQAAQQQPLSPTVQIVNQGFDFSPASFEELSPESQSILDSLMPPPPAPRTSSPAGVGVPVGNVSRSPVPAVRGPVQARPTQGGKQPRRRPLPPPRPRRGGDGGGGGGDDGDDSGPSNGSDTPRSRRSGVPSDRGDLQDAFEQMSDRERQRLRKRNVQSVTHTSTITTVYKDGRPPSVRRTSTRESPSPNPNSV